MRPLALGGAALLVLVASAAIAQTAADTLAGMAATQEAEKGMAGQARSVSKSAIATVFGGAAAPAAPAAAAPPAPAAAADRAAAWAAEDAQAGVPPADVEGADAATPPTDPAALAAGRRDPFRPFTLDLQRADVPEEAILSPLQRYEIAQLKLTGLVLDLRTPRAMLQDSSGMGYIVTPGTPIGRRHGVVKSIEPGRVVVEESVLDYYGRQQLHQVVMEMPRDDKKDDSGGKP